MNLETDLKDEVGDLIIAFGEMTDNIKKQAEAAERIAAGDLELEIIPRSDKDKLAYDDRRGGFVKRSCERSGRTYRSGN